MIAVAVLFLLGATYAASNRGTHWVVIPDKYTPGTPLPVTFTFYNTSRDDVEVQVDLLTDDHHRVTSLTQTFKEGKAGILQLQVPNLPNNPGTYTLLINGFSGVFFQEHGIVHYDSGNMPEKFAVHIQTDKGIYKPGQTVRFRAFGVSSDMMVYTGTFNVTIEDPKGNKMKQMVNVSEPNYGVIEDFLIMDTEPVLGQWKINVDVRNKASESKYFSVDKYVLPKFEVNVELPPFVVTTDSEMHGTVKATYTYGKPVIGSVKLYADIDYSKSPWKYHGDEVMVEAAFDINGEAKFTVPFSRITNEVDPNSFEPLVEKLAGYHLQIKASVTESINNITRNATAQVLFYKEPYRVEFDTSSSMPFFKPGLIYKGQVSVTQANGNPVISTKPEVKLITYVKFYDPTSYKYRAHYLREQMFTPPSTGALTFSVDPPENATSLHIEVQYQGLSDTMNVNKPNWLTENGNIQISLNSTTMAVGGNATFNIEKADELTQVPLFYAVIANDRMVHSGVMYNNASNMTTLTFPVTDEMKPYGKLVAYYFKHDIWNADALYFDVQEDSKIFKNKVAISFDKVTAEPGDKVSLSVTTNPMSLVNLLAVDQSVMYLATGNDVTRNDVITSLRIGSHAAQDSTELHDPKRVMKTPGMQVLTDVDTFAWAHPFYKRQLNCDCQRCPQYQNLPTACSLARDPSNPCCRIPKCSFVALSTMSPGGTGTGTGTMTGTGTGTGTMTGTGWSHVSTCRDNLDCQLYSHDVCSEPLYQPWVLKNCVKYCNLCSPDFSKPLTGSGCVNIITDCPDYGTDVCTSHRDWSRDNCAQYCGFCSAGTHHISGSTCEDKLSTCDLLDRSFYCGGEYYEYALQNCAKFCGLCSNTGTTDLQQVEHTRDSFPETWIWTNFTVGSNGTGILTTTVPDTITSWYATAFSVNALSGLGLTDGASKFTTFRPFFINLNLPYSVVRGEEVVLQANVFNYMGQDLDVVVTLEKSADFKVIVHDAPGHATFVSRDITQTVHIEAGQAKSIFVPVVANVVGAAEIAVKAQTVLSADRVKKELIVVAEGTPMHFNIPLILNENTAVDVPLSFPPSFVADSQKIQVSAIGDTMGPTVNNLKSLLRMPTGCGEQTMTSLAPDVFVYNYLKKTNKLTSDVKAITLEYTWKGYQRELTFQRTDGSFSIWGESDNQGSMWLTAFVLKSFHQAREHIFVSDDVLQRAASWILSYQNSDGSFWSIGSVHSTSLQGGSNSGYSLTAFVLIALTEAEMTLRYNNYNYNNGVARARVYLEQALNNNTITDIYDLAIVSYALSKTGSAKAFLAYKQLDKLSVTTGDGRVFWNMTRTRRQNSWEYSYYQSPPLEIEAASYALLYLVHSGQLQTGYPVLRWLVSQRNSRGGFRSTQDTVLGLQAMSEYGAMFKDAIDLTIDIASGSFNKQIHIGKMEEMVLKLVDVPHSAVTHSNNSGNTPPSISLQAHGSGSALAQVSVSFNVETEVSLPAFNITTTIVKETLRSLVVHACARYLPQRFTSPGMAVIEIDLPSGFSADLESSITKVDHARQTEIREEKTVVLYYDQILPSYPETCATVEMIRTDLVAKTKPAAIRVFDYYEPDNRALSFYESKLLKDSSFCDICNTCGCN